MKKALILGAFIVALMAPAFAQEANPSKVCDIAPISSKIDVMITQSSNLVDSFHTFAEQLPDKNYIDADFSMLDKKMSDRIDAQFPNLVLVLIGSTLINISLILLLKRWRVI